MGAPVRLQKAVSGLKENAAVERREARRSASWTGSSLPLEGRALPQGEPRGAAFRTSAFRRSAPLTFGEGTFPLVGEGMEMPAHPAPYKKQGRRSFFSRRLFEM